MYQRLMDGLEAVELKLSEVMNENVDLRLDSEYFRKDNLHLLSLLKAKAWKKINHFAFVTDGIHTSIDYSNDSNINLISATSPRENYFDLSRSAFISKESHDKNSRTALRVDDVIVSTVGTIGNCAVVDQETLPANSDRHVGIIRINKEFKPRFISTFLVSKFGRFQTVRESTGNVQLNLFIYKIRNLIVPKLSETFQERIEMVVSNALNCLKQCKSIYDQAENILLDELCLHNWRPSEKNTEVKSFKDSFLQSGRLDAEHYQSKFDELFHKLSQTGRAKPLGNLLGFNQRGKQPVYTEGKGLPVLNSKHIRINKIELDEDNRFADPAQSTEALTIKKDDVLFNGTGVGTIGRCAPYLLDAPALPDNHVTILRTNSIDPVFLSVQLNSIVGQLQVEKYQKGSSGQIELYPSDIAQFIIWDAPEEVQFGIKTFVEQAYELEKESKRLLELAKRAVEMAIEENEGAAMNFLNGKRSP